MDYEIKDSGSRQEFPTGAVRDLQDGKGRFDLLPADCILRIAKHYEAGSRKYGDRNWERGMPQSRFMDSARRHLFRYLDGYRDEDHLAAAAFNVLGLMRMEDRNPGMVDIPARTDQ
jgi:hypothetical protein